MGSHIAVLEFAAVSPSDVGAMFRSGKTSELTTVISPFFTVATVFPALSVIVALDVFRLKKFMASVFALVLDCLPAQILLMSDAEI